jgi:Putative DNA-binding domain
LDYKSNWPSDLEKVICSFANTQGGIILIGVDEEDKTRKPKLPISGVEGEPAVIYQRVMNIASDGIYPPISPEIRVCKIPDENSKCVVLVRISPSKLMHSTDRRRKIYVRVADNSRGYDLASVSDLEWLWERKILLEEKRMEIYKSAIDHSNSRAIPWKSAQDEEHWNIVPKLHISIIPLFPNPENLVEQDVLLKLVQSLPRVTSLWPNVSVEIPHQIGEWRSIPDGVCTSNRGYSTHLEYLEFGQMAHFHATIGIETWKTSTLENGLPIDFTWAYIILSYVDITLKFAQDYFNALQYTWPLTLNAVFEPANPIVINYAVPKRRSQPADYLSSFAPDKILQLLDRELSPNQLEEESLMFTVANNLFWAFGLGWDKLRVSNWLKITISQNP